MSAFSAINPSVLPHKPSTLGVAINEYTRHTPMIPHQLLFSFATLLVLLGITVSLKFGLYILGPREKSQLYKTIISALFASVFLGCATIFVLLAAGVYF